MDVTVEAIGWAILRVAMAGISGGAPRLALAENRAKPQAIGWPFSADGFVLWHVIGLISWG